MVPSGNGNLYRTSASMRHWLLALLLTLALVPPCTMASATADHHDAGAEHPCAVGDQCPFFGASDPATANDAGLPSGKRLSVLAPPPAQVDLLTFAIPLSIPLRDGPPHENAPVYLVTRRLRL